LLIHGLSPEDHKTIECLDQIKVHDVNPYHRC